MPDRWGPAVAAIAMTTSLVLGAGTGTAGAQPAEAPPVTVGPDGGSRAGTRVIISGEGCIDDTRTGVVIQVDYLGDDAQRSFTIPWSSPDHPTAPLAVEDDGSWTATYVVAADDPIGTYGLQATCYNEVTTTPRNTSPFFDYAPATFEVTDEPFVPEMSMSIDPTSGPAGTTIEVSGGDCPGGAVTMLLLAGTSRSDATHLVSWWFASGDEDGNWAEHLRVSSTMAPLGDPLAARVPVVPGADHVVVAGCNPDGRVGLFTTEPGSDAIPFDITAGGEPTPPPEAPPAELVPSLGAPPLALPATPVAGQPTYTG